MKISAFFKEKDADRVLIQVMSKAEKNFPKSSLAKVHETFLRKKISFISIQLGEKTQYEKANKMDPYGDIYQFDDSESLLEQDIVDEIIEDICLSVEEKVVEAPVDINDIHDQVGECSVEHPSADIFFVLAQNFWVRF